MVLDVRAQPWLRNTKSKCSNVENTKMYQGACIVIAETLFA
jgi:hypothetical protein